VMPKAGFVILSIALITAISANVAEAYSDKAFRVHPAAEYAHQTSGQVTIGAKPYGSEELIAEAFGRKTDLLKYGVLPVLVVVENKGQKTLDLRALEINLVSTDGRHVGPIAPEDIQYLRKTSPRATVTPLPVPLPRKKNPLSAPELTTRAFAAQMLPPGDSASGFFYFEAKPEPGDKLYVNRLRDARNGQEIMYFEFPVD
jgi:hypothetical protein